MDNESAYYNDPEFKRALRTYERMLESGRQTYMDADVLADIAEFYLSRNKEVEADRCVDFALKLHPNDTLLLILKARRFLDKGDVQAATAIENSINDKEDYEVQLFHAELLLYNFEFEEADKYLETKFPRVESQGDVEDVEDIVGLFLDYEQPQRALNWLQRIEGKSNGYTFFFLKALAYLHLERYEECITTVNQCLDVNPYYVRGWGVLADAQYSLQKYEKAIESCDYALVISPYDEIALRFKAKSLYELHDYAGAHAVYEVLLKASPNNAEDLLFDGICLNFLDRPSEALRQLKRAGSKCSPDATRTLLDIYEQLACAYNILEDYKEAMICREQAVRLGADKSTLLLQHIYELLQLRRTDEAIPQCISLFQNEEYSYSVRLQLVAVISDCGYDELAYKMLLVLCKHSQEAVDDGAYAYMAHVCRRLSKDEEYLHYLGLACEYTPEKAWDIFGRDFPGCQPEDFPKEAERQLREDKNRGMSDPA